MTGTVVCIAAFIGLIVVVVPASPTSRSGGGRAVSGVAGARPAPAIGRASSSPVAVASSTSSTTAAPPATGPGTATATPVPSPCARNRRNQLVVVSLARQRMWLCHRGATTRAVPITTGRDGHGDATPTGSFHVQGRNRNSVLDPGNRGKEYDVKYWLPFDAPNYGFHDASWQHTGYGDSGYRAAHGSEGCVHMPLAAIRFFYNWVHMGTKVHITRA